MSNNEETDKRAGSPDEEGSDSELFVRPKRRKTGEIYEEEEEKDKINDGEKSDSNSNSNKTPTIDSESVNNYVCTICQKSFGKDRNLKTHIRKRHVSPAEAQEQWEKRLKKHRAEQEKLGKSFHCVEPSCKKSFATKPQLDSHVKGAHNPEHRRVNKCKVEGCGRVFTRRGAIKSHMRAVHGPKSN